MLMMLSFVGGCEWCGWQAVVGYVSGSFSRDPVHARACSEGEEASNIPIFGPSNIYFDLLEDLLRTRIDLLEGEGCPATACYAINAVHAQHRSQRGHRYTKHGTKMNALAATPCKCMRFFRTLDSF